MAWIELTDDEVRAARIETLVLRSAGLPVDPLVAAMATAEPRSVEWIEEHGGSPESTRRTGTQTTAVAEAIVEPSQASREGERVAEGHSNRVEDDEELSRDAARLRPELNTAIRQVMDIQHRIYELVEDLQDLEGQFLKESLFAQKAPHTATGPVDVTVEEGKAVAKPASGSAPPPPTPPARWTGERQGPPRGEAVTSETTSWPVDRQVHEGRLVEDDRIEESQRDS